MQNNTVHFNFLANVFDTSINEAGAHRNRRGIDFGGSNFSRAAVAHNKVYYNILINITHEAIRSMASQPVDNSAFSWVFLNNVVYNAGVGIGIVTHLFPWNSRDKLWTGFGHLFANNLLIDSKQNHVRLAGLPRQLYGRYNQMRNNLYYGSASFCSPMNQSRSQSVSRGKVTSCPLGDEVNFTTWVSRSGLDRQSLMQDPLLSDRKDRAVAAQQANDLIPHAQSTVDWTRIRTGARFCWATCSDG